jgi:acetolactate synthase-1/2/3 large subunit
LVLTIGSHARVPLTKWGWSKGKTLARIDVDPSTHDLIRKADIALTARAEDALPKLIAALESANHQPTLRPQAIEEARREWGERSAVLEPQISYLRAIRDALGKDGIFVDELTQVGFASRIVMDVHEPRTFLSTGYMGTLGWGFPTALGAKVACPDRRVISVTGDGGFMFAATELATAVHHGIALVTVVFNNNQYGNVQQMQRELYGNRVIATNLTNPDFVKFAESFGAHAARVDSPAQLGRALDAAFESGLPAVIEVEVGEMISVDRFR